MKITDVTSCQFEAVITRADGTVEKLGTIGYWHKNPLKRYWWHIKQKFAASKFFVKKKEK